MGRVRGRFKAHVIICIIAAIVIGIMLLVAAILIGGAIAVDYISEKTTPHSKEELYNYAKNNFGECEIVDFVKREYSDEIKLTVKDKEYGFEYTVESTKGLMNEKGELGVVYHYYIKPYFNYSYIEYILNSNEEKISNLENEYECEIAATGDKESSVSIAITNKNIDYESIASQIAEIVKKLDTREYYKDSVIAISYKRRNNNTEYNLYDYEKIGEYGIYSNVSKDKDTLYEEYIKSGLINKIRLGNDFIEVSDNEVKYIKNENTTFNTLPDIAKHYSSDYIESRKDKNVSVYYYEYKDQTWLGFIFTDDAIKRVEGFRIK